MNFKPAFPLILLLLYAALHAPAFAQSGTIHFKGRIIAPVCSGTLFAERSPPDAAAGQAPVFSMDNTGCENNSGGLVADIRAARHEAPQAMHTGDARSVQNNPDPVWTITYH